MARQKERHLQAKHYLQARGGFPYRTPLALAGDGIETRGAGGGAALCALCPAMSGSPALNEFRLPPGSDNARFIAGAEYSRGASP